MDGKEMLMIAILHGPEGRRVKSIQMYTMVSTCKQEIRLSKPTYKAKPLFLYNKVFIEHLSCS